MTVQEALLSITDQRWQAVLVAKVRERAGLSKRQFDRQSIELYRQGLISLHQHDAVGLLWPVQREVLVDDSQGRYYVAMSWTEKR